MSLKIKKTVEVELDIALPYFGKTHGQTVAILENGKTFKIFVNCIFITETVDEGIINELEKGYYKEISKADFIMEYQHTANNIYIEMMNVKGQSENEFIKNVSIASGEM